MKFLLLLVAMIAICMLFFKKSKKGTPAAAQAQATAPAADPREQLFNYCCTLYGINPSINSLHYMMDYKVETFGPICICNDGYLYFYGMVRTETGIMGERTMLAISSITAVNTITCVTTLPKTGEQSDTGLFAISTCDGNEYSCPIFERDRNNTFQLSNEFSKALSEAIAFYRDTPGTVPVESRNQQLIARCYSHYGIDSSSHQLAFVLDGGVDTLGPVCICDDGCIYFYSIGMLGVGDGGEKTQLPISSIKTVSAVSCSVTFPKIGKTVDSNTFMFTTHDDGFYRCAILEDNDEKTYKSSKDFAHTLELLGLEVDLRISH